MNTSSSETPKPYNPEELSSVIEQHVTSAVSGKREFSYDGLPPIVAREDLVPAVQKLLHQYVEQDDTDAFLILFHAYPDAMNTLASTLPWDAKEKQAKKRVHSNLQFGISRAIKELWEDKEKSEKGDLLLKLTMKLGIIRQDDIRRIRDLVGVPDTAGDDRL